MAANPPERAPRRVAVILGTASSGRKLLDLLLPLLTRDREIEMHGVFLEEAEVQHAAELPFVKELCRVTFSVREFTSDQFERSLALRMRTAQRALSVLARRTGVAHSFRNVRGPAVRLLRETATVSDITVFEPARQFGATVSRPLRGDARQPRVIVAIGDLEGGRPALLAAGDLADGRSGRVCVLLSGTAAEDLRAVSQLCEETLSGLPGSLRRIPPEGGVSALIDAAHEEAAALFVIAATDELLEPATLQMLRERLRCPICLVRQWQSRTGKMEARSDG
jgi:hypothetical protein